MLCRIPQGSHRLQEALSMPEYALAALHGHRGKPEFMSCFGSAGMLAPFKPPHKLNQPQKKAPVAEDEGQVSAKSLEMLAGMP